jgi:spore coat polysaccharide biosynthesis protein SpsF
MKIIACSQARFDSTRLPGKVLTEVNGIPLLEFHIRRLAKAERVTEHVIATSVLDDDNGIVQYCQQCGVKVVRGSKDNVLKRFSRVIEALSLSDDDRIIRLTADCPMVDAALIDELITHHLKTGDDYTSINTGKHIRGFDAEIMTVAALKSAAQQATLEYEFEHVTPFIYQHPNLFKCGQYRVFQKVTTAARLCIDEDADLQMFEKLVQCYPASLVEASSIDIMAFMAAQPVIANINLHVYQKQLGE